MAYDETQQLPDQARRQAIERRLERLNHGDTTGINPNRGKVFEFKSVV